MDDGLTIPASAEGPGAPCPLRGRRSSRIHGRYPRTLADLPWAEAVIRLQVRVRTFFREDTACPRKIFAERLTGVAQAWARRSRRQGRALSAIAFALGGEAGARLAHHPGMPTSPDTLLRLIRRDPETDRLLACESPLTRVCDPKSRMESRFPSRHAPID